MEELFEASAPFSARENNEESKVHQSDLETVQQTKKCVFIKNKSRGPNGGEKLKKKRFILRLLYQTFCRETER